MNQHESTSAHRRDIAAFDQVVRACTGGTIVVMGEAMGAGEGRVGAGEKAAGTACSRGKQELEEPQPILYQTKRN